MTLVAGRHPPRRRRQHRGSQSQADLGRGLADQGRRARPGLCGGRAGPADRASGHQPGAAQHRYDEAAAGAGGARADSRRAPEEHQRPPRHPGPGSADRVTRRSLRWAGWCSSSCRSKRPMRRFTGAAALGLVLLGALVLAVLAGHIPRAADGRADPGAARPARRGSAAAISRQRISIKTGDELEGLADQFNDMGGRLQESYADLEKKVEVAHARVERVAGAADGDLRSTAASSAARPANCSRFSKSMLENATRICGANFGMMGLYDKEAFRNVAMYNAPPAFADHPETRKFQPNPESGLSRVIRTRQVVQIEDLRPGACTSRANRP